MTGEILIRGRKEWKGRLNYTKKIKDEKRKRENEVNQRLTGVSCYDDIRKLYTSISTSMERDFNTFGDE